MIRGATGRGIKELYKYLNDPNRFIKNTFKYLDNPPADVKQILKDAINKFNDDIIKLNEAMKDKAGLTMTTVQEQAIKDDIKIKESY